MTLPWSRVHLIAATEAIRAHVTLRVDTSRQVDPFAALDVAGVLVFRRRLDHLAGLYLPPDPQEGREVAAVLINVAHPPSKQRFTAAHELCHHLRDHAVTLDKDTEWLGRGEEPLSDRERLAEAFAAWFLMPKRLVLSTLGSLSLGADTLSADGAYTLSLELGTSYAATVRHLVDMRLLSSRRSGQLLKVPPQMIKQEIAGPGVAADAWKDVHRVRVARPAADSGIEVAVLEGDAVVLEVPETPSSGYLWQLPTAPAGLALMRDEYQTLDGDALGGRGWHRFLFRVEASGHFDMVLEMRRPWQRGTAAQTAHVAVTARPQPISGIAQPGLLVAA